MATYGVNPNGMLDTGAELEIVTRRIQSSIDGLRAAVMRFQQDSHGAAIDTFGAAQTKWQAGIDQMNASLADAQRRLEDIRQRYVLTDNRGAALFGGRV